MRACVRGSGAGCACAALRRTVHEHGVHGRVRLRLVILAVLPPLARVGAPLRVVVARGVVAAARRRVLVRRVQVRVPPRPRTRKHLRLPRQRAPKRNERGAAA